MKRISVFSDNGTQHIHGLCRTSDVIRPCKTQVVKYINPNQLLVLVGGLCVWLERKAMHCVCFVFAFNTDSYEVKII